MYRINKIFYSLQGEGINTGIPMVFIRFSGCNLNCVFCDTNHFKFNEMGIDEIINKVKKYDCNKISLCGGEPTLQVDDNLIKALKENGYWISIESNGTRPIHNDIDYKIISPKVSIEIINHVHRGAAIDELKFVLKKGDIVPQNIIAKNLLISPMFDGDTPVAENICYCIAMTKIYNIRMTYQSQKAWGID